MSEKVNICDIIEAACSAPNSALGLVRLGEDETAIILFTADAERVKIHYCPDDEVKGYVLCNEEGCALCRAGRKPDTRHLLPVVVPAAGGVGVLPVPPSLRPKALLPQLYAVLKAGKPMVAFVTRKGDQYTVTTRELPEGTDDGAKAICEFQAALEAGTVELSAVYQTIDNEQLAQLPEVAKMLALKGGPK